MTIQEKTINTIRVLSADMVQKANSGHPGAPMGMAPMAYALWVHCMKHHPASPDWPDRDRFALSSGHASALQYAIMHLAGYPLSMDDLKQFRQWESKTPGHPERDPAIGIEVTTGPLGQGIANAVGLAIAETKLAAQFNRPGFELVNHRTYAICGDGCMMEGISGEACSLAGTLKLSKLTVLYDDNGISIEGDTDLAFTEDVGMRFEAYGWQVIRLKDGNDYREILMALEEAEKNDLPTLIICPTIIGYGCAEREGKAIAHGEPLGEDNLAAVRKRLAITADPFTVPEDVYQHISNELKKNQSTFEKWQAAFKDYGERFPELRKAWEQWHSNNVDIDALLHDDALLSFPEKATATRADSSVMINRLAKFLPNLVGGSADLAPSNKTMIEDGGSYSADNRSGRNFHFGVREHAMAAICNGIAAHGGLRVFCATFFVFSDYMKNAIRMSALMNLPIIYVLTHDSIGVGEDGATHQPIEHLAGLRTIPNLMVYRPADGRETAVAWLLAISRKGPTCIVLTRQNTPNHYPTSIEARKGAYTLIREDNPQLLLIASGSEVQYIVETHQALKEKGIRAKVISMPCMELFFQQDREYQESILPNSCRDRISIEAGSTLPWYRVIGLDGVAIGLDHYGASAPGACLFAHYGMTTENVLETALRITR